MESCGLQSEMFFVITTIEINRISNTERQQKRLFLRKKYFSLLFDGIYHNNTKQNTMSLSYMFRSDNVLLNVILLNVILLSVMVPYLVLPSM